MTPAPGAAAPDFATEAARVFADLKRCFARLIEARSPGTQAVSAVAEGLGVHRKLAWQAVKVAYTENPYSAARHLPTSKGLAALFKAARGAGVAASIIDDAANAAARVEALAERHAPTREEFDLLLESMAGPSEDDTRYREQMFIGSSSIWGARCRTLLGICCLLPSKDRAGWFDVAQVRGLLGFRQTRPGVRWLVNEGVVADDQAATRETHREPLDPKAAAAHQGVPVITELCSSPMPELIRRRTGGFVRDEFVSGPVGLAGERSLVTGEVIRALAPAHATPDDKTAHFGMAVRTPSEALVFDLFTHRSLFEGVTRELRVFSDVASPVAFDDADTLPFAERPTELGPGVAQATAAELPGYADLAEHVFERLDADPADFNLCRVRIAYPALQTTVMLRHPLPEPT